MNFYIHFFKEKEQIIEVIDLFKFFDTKEHFTRVYNKEKEEYTIFYNNLALQNRCQFKITKVTQVPNMYKVSGRYVSLNFFIEIPLLVPKYFAYEILEIINELTSKFKLYVFNKAFDDAIKYDIKYIAQVWNKYQNHIIKNQNLKIELYYINKDKHFDVCKYQEEHLNLKMYYKIDGIKVYPYQVMINKEEEKVVFSIKWKDGESIIIPPHLDYVHYTCDHKEHILPYAKVYKIIKMYLKDLPGFIKGVKILKVENSIIYKKIRKIIANDLDVKKFAYINLINVMGE